MGKFDHLSSDKFWDLVYDTAKNKKKKKQLWRTLMSPEYADVVRHLSERHIKRLEDEVSEEDIVKHNSNVSAYIFIKNIRGSAIHAIEKHRAEQKHIRRYEDISLLHEYVAYLKDTIEDLRTVSEFLQPATEFDLYTSIEDMQNNVSTQLDDWINSRIRRRDENHDLD